MMEHRRFSFVVVDENGEEIQIGSCDKQVSPRKGEYVWMPFNWERKKEFGTRAFIVEDVAHHIPYEGNKGTYDNIVIYCTPIKINNDLESPREFQIWMEGYIATGEHGTAQIIGTGVGDTFDDAVRDFMSKNPEHKVEENKRTRYTTEEAYQNRRSNWNIWACNLYDNEQDARKSFG